MILEILCGLIIACCVFLYVRNVKDKRLEEIPGPPGYPIIGNSSEFLTSAEIKWTRFRELGKKYYPIYVTRQLFTPNVRVLNPEDMKIVMSSTVHLSKGNTYKQLMHWLNTGLLTSTGKKWQQRRKLLTPAFHYNILHEFLLTFNHHSQSLIKRLEDECSKPYTNIVPFINETTLQSVSETAMGTRLEENSKSSLEYMNSVYRSGQLVIKIISNPLCQNIITAMLIPIFWEYKKLIKTLHKFTTDVINKRKATFDESKLGIKRMALLDLLIKVQKTEENIEDEGIREEVDTFMFEGHDTTTACISFALMLLANHADVQNKVVEELTDIFGTSDRMPTYQDLQNMKYLDQVLKESLRLYPSVPSISRIAAEDFQTSSNYTIPKGTSIILQIYDLHHSEHIYPDPEKFDPDRFLPENCKNRHPFAYIPFSAGPRNCIGQRFALLEVKTVISSILRNYELLPVDTPTSIKLVMHLVLKSTNGIKLKFSKRL